MQNSRCGWKVGECLWCGLLWVVMGVLWRRRRKCPKYKRKQENGRGEERERHEVNFLLSTKRNKHVVIFCEKQKEEKKILRGQTP